jgi:hypothetical protein
MSRNKRILTVVLGALFLLVLLPEWSPARQQVSPAYLGLGLLLLLCLLEFLSPFRPAELLLFSLVLLPMVYMAFQLFSELASGRALLLGVECLLALSLAHFLAALARLLLKGPTRASVRLLVLLSVPALFAFVLLEASPLVSVALPALAGAVFYYARSARARERA